MKYKLINSQTKEETLCDKVTIDEFDYYVSDEEIKVGDWVLSDKSISPIFLDGGDLYPQMLDLNQWCKVIATNNPNINDIPKVVDDVERLAIIYCKEMNRIGEFHDIYSFKHAYNKSQETHPFSLEDMIEFAWWLKENLGQFSCDRTAHFKGEYFKIWKKQQPKTLYYVST